MLGLNYGFLWKTPTFYKLLINTTKLCVDLLKNLIDVSMKHMYSEIQHTALLVY